MRRRRRGITGRKRAFNARARKAKRKNRKLNSYRGARGGIRL